MQIKWLKHSDYRRYYRIFVPILKENPSLARTIIPRMWSSRKRLNKKRIEIIFLILQHFPQKQTELFEGIFENIENLSDSEQQIYLWKILFNFHKSDVLPFLIENISSLMLVFSYDELVTYLDNIPSHHPQGWDTFLRIENSESQKIMREIKGTQDLESIKGMLTLYARAHSDSTVNICISDRAFSDGKHIYLPSHLDVKEPQKLYRLLTARNAGYLEFGTLDIDLSRIDRNWRQKREGELEIECMFRSFTNPTLAKDLFLILENYRIRCKLIRSYPGLAQLFDQLGHLCDGPRPDLHTLSDCERYVEELYLWLHHKRTPSLHRSILSLYKDDLAQGTVYSSIHALIYLYEQCSSLLRRDNVYRSHPSREGLKTHKMSKKDRQKRIKKEKVRSLKTGEKEFDYREASAFMDRNQAPAGPKVEKKTSLHRLIEKDSKRLEGMWCYPEWDAHLEDEKPSYTKVYELCPNEGDLSFVDSVCMQYQFEIARLRKIFQMLRAQEETKVRHLRSGERLDIDALISAHINKRNGFFDERLYTGRIKNRRSIAVSFLLDLSSSTNELVGSSTKRIIDIQKEALVIISEALDALGDDFSIYGFSGYGRDQVAVYPIKKMHEPWAIKAKQRLGHTSWRMENRDGAAIRHITHKLSRASAKKKILIILSDGRPLDCGCSLYKDVYAQEDTYKAIQEARKKGIYPFCITVDPQGKDYLEKMYGRSYVVINTIEALPMRIPYLYRQWTR